jgi:hypothetical protein
VLEPRRLHQGLTIQIASKEELIACFRRIDRKQVELADDLTFPITLKRVFTWTWGTRSFVIFSMRGADEPHGIVFRHSGAPGVATMCHWCQRTRPRGEVKLLSARVSGRRTVGQYVCADLSCFRDENNGVIYESPAEVLHRIDRAFAKMYELYSAKLKAKNGLS